MKIIVAIVVYNRLQNLQHWIRCWKECNKENAELVIIHTGTEVEKFKSVCEGATYIHRENIGFDIGCFQDVCKEKLQGFPNDWDYILWCTDDTFPMTKDFIQPFIEALENKQVGLSCMQISKSKPGNIIHVRTTGFCISKETSKKLTFPADPITTKQHCYLFEHRNGKNILSEQVRAMGLDVVQVAKNEVSPLWDSGFWKRLDRKAEHDAIFPSGKTQGDKVTVIATIYDSYPQIVSSMLLQTHQNWNLILIHDGPASDSVKSGIDLTDQRVTFIETKERKGNYGHHLRQWALEEIREGRLSDPDYIVIQNADNYLTPRYVQYLLDGFKKNHTTVATYCSGTVHSYKNWQVLPAKLERGYLDCGAVMIKKDIACEVGWSNITDHSADWIYFSEIAAKYSWTNFQEVKGVLFVHN